jgi:vacuolar-type H+-ATPase subunit E/Vma4
LGLEELREEIVKRTQEEIARIDAEASEEEKRTLSAAEHGHREILAKAKADIERMVRAEREERIAAARLGARRKVADAHEEVLAKGVERVWLAFIAIRDTADYPALLKGIVEGGAREIGEGCVVSVRKEDADLVRKMKAKLGEPLETEGGAVISSPDGKICIRSTLREIFEQHREDVKKQLSDAIFGAGK